MNAFRRSSSPVVGPTNPSRTPVTSPTTIFDRTDDVFLLGTARASANRNEVRWDRHDPLAGVRLTRLIAVDVVLDHSDLTLAGRRQRQGSRTEHDHL